MLVFASENTPTQWCDEIFFEIGFNQSEAFASSYSVKWAIFNSLKWNVKHEINKLSMHSMAFLHLGTIFINFSAHYSLKFLELNHKITILIGFSAFEWFDGNV